MQTATTGDATYGKPNMAALEGDVGRSIYEAVLNAPDTDWDALRAQSQAIEKRIAEAFAYASS